MGVYFWRGVFDRVFKRVRALGQIHRLQVVVAGNFTQRPFKMV